MPLWTRLQLLYASDIGYVQWYTEYFAIDIELIRTPIRKKKSQLISKKKTLSTNIFQVRFVKSIRDLLKWIVYYKESNKNMFIFYINFYLIES